MWSCAYCGSSPSKKSDRTKDHIPPRCLFRKPYPTDLVTVPACSRCHGSTSKDDEYFRIVTSMRDDVYQHDEADLDRTHRALEGPARNLARIIGRSAYKTHRKTAGGIWVDALGYRVDHDRLERVARRIVRGLFYENRGERLPEGYRVEAFSDLDWRAVEPRLGMPVARWLLPQPRMEIGKGRGVFRYQCHFAPEDPATSVWLLEVFERVEFFAFTIRQDALIGQILAGGPLVGE